MMKKLKYLFVFPLILFTACSPSFNSDQSAALTPISSNSQNNKSPIIQTSARVEIPNRPSLSDINKSGKLLYFLVQSGEKVELKKRDLNTQKEELVRIFPYNNEILKFAIAADEQHIAFMSKEKDRFIVYITDLGGERLIKVEEAAATNGNQQLSPERFVLKRVGLNHKFLFINQTGLDCGGVILSYVSHHVVVTCSQNTEIIPGEQLLIIEPNSGKSILATTGYESFEPKEIVEIPVAERLIENLELLDEKTVRITTEKEYMYVKFKD